MTNDSDLNAKTEPVSDGDSEPSAAELHAIIAAQQQEILTLHETQKAQAQAIENLQQDVIGQAQAIINLSDYVETLTEGHTYFARRPSGDGHGPGPKHGKDDPCFDDARCFAIGVHSENHGDREAECKWHTLYNDNEIRRLETALWMLEYQYYQVLARYGDPDTSLAQFALHVRNFGRKQQQRPANGPPQGAGGIVIDLTTIEAGSAHVS